MAAIIQKRMLLGSLSISQQMPCLIRSHRRVSIQRGFDFRMVSPKDVRKGIDPIRQDFPENKSPTHPLVHKVTLSNKRHKDT